MPHSASKVLHEALGFKNSRHCQPLCLLSDHIRSTEDNISDRNTDFLRKIRIYRTLLVETWGTLSSLLSHSLTLLSRSLLSALTSSFITTLERTVRVIKAASLLLLPDSNY